MPAPQYSPPLVQSVSAAHSLHALVPATAENRLVCSISWNEAGNGVGLALTSRSACGERTTVSTACERFW